MKRLVYIATAPVRWLLAPFRWLAARWRAVYRFFTEVPPDEPLADTIARPFQGGAERSLFLQGLLENLNDLRQHLFRAVLALIIATLLSFVFAERLMAILAVPLGDEVQLKLLELFRLPFAEALPQFLELGVQGMAKMQVIEPTESISVFMRVSLLAGLVLSMPFIVWEIYLFIAPGLMPASRFTLFWGLPLASLLFIAGILFTYLVMLPTAVPFLYTFGGFRQAWRPLK
jgi:Sec-independent protein secretion pathway component TatC